MSCSKRIGRILTAVFGTVWAIAVAPGARAEWYEQTKLLASHRQAYANFGQSVAIDGNLAIVGAFRENAAANGSGAAYVFQNNGSGWDRVARLAASDGMSSAEFGISVAVSGDTAIVGAYRDRENGLDSGAAYIFRDTRSGWEQVAKLMASDGTGLELFGRSVAISGGTAVVGAAHDPDNGDLSGSAYVFQENDGMWGQVVKLLPADPVEDHHFGSSVAIRGNTVFVGAIHDHDVSWRAGSAYVFQDTGSGWEQIAKLLPDGEPAPDHFGWAISLEAGVAVIGATGHQDEADLPGSAYVFREDGSTWTQVARLQADDGTESASFGRSVSISGGTILVGARTADPVGSVYVFQEAGSSWAPVATLFPNDGKQGDRFGSSVALSSGTAVIGADFDSDNGYRSGAAYIFVVPEPTTVSLLTLAALCLLLGRMRRTARNTV